MQLQLPCNRNPSIHTTTMNEFTAHCHSWLPVPSVHRSSNSTTKQWYQKWIMWDLWGESSRVICQKTITGGNYGNRPLWRSKKKRERELRSRIKPKGTMLAGLVVIDCQWKSPVESYLTTFLQMSFWRGSEKAYCKKTWEKSKISVLKMCL